jgi:hypothetical protein
MIGSVDPLFVPAHRGHDLRRPLCLAVNRGDYYCARVGMPADFASPGTAARMPHARRAFPSPAAPRRDTVPRVADIPGDRSRITPRHWAVVGSLRFGRGKATPEVIARELGFDLDEVIRLLGDLERAGFEIKPTRSR